MEPMNWAPEHSDALRQYLAKGMSFSEAAGAINAKFSTAYTRNAALGRAKRMGFVAPDRPARPPKPRPQANAPRLQGVREQHSTERARPVPVPVPMPMPAPVMPSAERVTLRCIQIVPRHLSVIDLEAGDCRYPYGGDEDGEAITFCGHSQLRGSSYCAGHFHLTRGPGTASERAAGPVTLRLVEAA